MRQSHVSDNGDAYAFRRSRTMTGSLSNTVRAAAENRADLQSERVKHHNLRRQRHHLTLSLIGTMIAIVGVVALINQFILSVHVLSARTFLSDSDVQQYDVAIGRYLSAHPNERFSFSLRQDALTVDIQRQFPEVKSVVLEVQPWLQAAKARVTLRQAIASWTLGSTKYYIDDRGVAYRKNSGSEPALVVEDKSGLDPSITGMIASEKMLRYIGRLVALLGQKGLAVERIELPPGASREVDVYLRGKAYAIKTHLDRDPAGQAADVANAVNFLTQKGIVPAYADVRVSSKLYYK